jgi:hypothetical protein
MWGSCNLPWREKQCLLGIEEGSVASEGRRDQSFQKAPIVVLDLGVGYEAARPAGPLIALKPNFADLGDHSTT